MNMPNLLRDASTLAAFSDALHVFCVITFGGSNIFEMNIDIV